MTLMSTGSGEAARRRTAAGVALCAVLLACSFCIGCLGAATGTLKLSSTPEGAVVYVDGALMGTTPVLLDVTEGTHRIEMRLDGYEDWTHTAVIGAGKTSYFSGTLQRPVIATPTPTPEPVQTPTPEPGPSPAPTATATAVIPTAAPGSADEEFLHLIPLYSTTLFGYRNQIGFYPTEGASTKHYGLMQAKGEVLKKTADRYSSNMTKLKVGKTYAIPQARFKSFIDWYAKAGSALMLAAEYNGDREWKLRDIWLDAAENAYDEGDKAYLSAIEQLRLPDLRPT